MADSHDMATLAFGARRGSKIAGRALRGLRGAGAPRKKSSKRRPKHHGGGSRGIRFSNDFVKALLLMGFARGMMHS